MKGLMEKIQSRKASVGVMGLGYVGLPLATAFSRFFRVVGYDPNKDIIATLKQGRSHIMDVPDSAILGNNNFSAVSSPLKLREADFILMCVPTPLVYEKEPDLSYIQSASRTVATFLRKGQFIILESTTYPGTTDEVVVPTLAETGLRPGVDFGVAYSQERIDPGNKSYPVDKIPKVVGGITPECTDIAAALYGNIIPKVHKVRDCKTAEACKILENTFRSVNIALVNELSLILEEMGIDIWEVIEAAKTKPFGYMPFYPGPGIGGHCIPLDPYYLAYKARRYGFFSRFIDLAGEVNDFMRIHTVNLIEAGLRTIGKEIRGSNIAVLGLAYKKDIDDSRESPSKKVIEELVGMGGIIRAYDPYVKEMGTRVGTIKSTRSMESALKDADCAAFLVDHTAFRRVTANQLKKQLDHAIVIDTRNIFKSDDMAGMTYLAIGKPNPSVTRPRRF
jgi:UDP-N-acetyl-D-glucosamine dehydrogenase